ncbi:unnamed protein product [Onchocerca flexuosa]|uniref:Peptidase M12A domain-containing protein n=1 Tax=Onchocerca flexuosa TaxID=387005 RepID=A0A183HQL3_9BILA|nr:unnamed protein product [Onchocerca flexuosa]
MAQLLCLIILLLLIQICEAILLVNSTLPNLPGMDIMSSSKELHIGIIERVSRTEFNLYRRRRRQSIAGPIYEWPSITIPYIIWGGDYSL